MKKVIIIDGIESRFIIQTSNLSVFRKLTDEIMLQKNLFMIYSLIFISITIWLHTFNEIVLGEDMVKTGLFQNTLAYCAQQYRKQLLAEQTSTNLQNMLLHPSLFLLVFSASCQLLFDSKNIFFRARSLARILAFLLQKKWFFKCKIYSILLHGQIIKVWYSNKKFQHL